MKKCTAFLSYCLGVLITSLLNAQISSPQEREELVDRFYHKAEAFDYGETNPHDFTVLLALTIMVDRDNIAKAMYLNKPGNKGLKMLDKILAYARSDLETQMQEFLSKYLEEPFDDIYLHGGSDDQLQKIGYYWRVAPTLRGEAIDPNIVKHFANKLTVFCDSMLTSVYNHIRLTVAYKNAQQDQSITKDEWRDINEQVSETYIDIRQGIIKHHKDLYKTPEQLRKKVIAESSGLKENAVDPTKVPSLDGLKIDQAYVTLNALSLGLDLEYGDPAPNPDQEDIIYEQQPKAGTPTANTSLVKAIIYGEHRGILIPDMEGWEIDKAIKMIKKLGLQYNGIEFGSDARSMQMIDRVEYILPQVDGELKKGDPVVVVIYNEPLEPETVPNVIGLQIDKAGQSVEASGFVPYFEYGEDTKDYQKDGVVYRQYPMGGDIAESGSKIQLLFYTWAGKKTTMPQLVGKTIEQAKTVMKKAGLFLNIKYGKPAPSAYQQGRVYWQHFDPGTEIDEGIGIDIRVYGKADTKNSIKNEPPNLGKVPVVRLPTSILGIPQKGDGVKIEKANNRAKDLKFQNGVVKNPDELVTIDPVWGGRCVHNAYQSSYEKGPDGKKEADTIRIQVVWAAEEDRVNWMFGRSTERPTGGIVKNYVIDNRLQGRIYIKSKTHYAFVYAHYELKQRTTHRRNALNSELEYIVQQVFKQVEPYTKRK